MAHLQGSSEHSICFALEQKEADRAAQVVRDDAERELRQGQIQRVDVTRDCSILAVVGDGMAGTPGIAAKLFNALGSSGVNVRAIAQGASERNISVVIDEKRRASAGLVQQFLPPRTPCRSAYRPGSVGSVFLDQLASQVGRLTNDFRLDLRLRGVLTSKKMVLADTAVPMPEWRTSLEGGVPTDLQQFVRHIDAGHLPHAVIVDCTASAEIARHYPSWLAAGIHIVTPNKQAGSADLAFYRPSPRRAAWAVLTIFTKRRSAGCRSFKPCAICVRRRSHPADRGCLSGTLSYLSTSGTARSVLGRSCAKRRHRGSRADPRDDLSATDVARN